MTVSPHDAQVALKRVSRRLAEAPSQVADELARVVRDTPDGRLEHLMRTPMRRVVLEGIFWQMPRFLARNEAARVTAAVRWCITGRGDEGTDTYHLEIIEGDCRVTRGATRIDPRLTITLDGAEFVRLATGNSNPIHAYFNGRVALTGDIMFAARLTSLFRFPKPRQNSPAGTRAQRG
jgi:SCP-2 sterol transfer family